MKMYGLTNPKFPVLLPQHTFRIFQWAVSAHSFGGPDVLSLLWSRYYLYCDSAVVELKT